MHGSLLLTTVSDAPINFVSLLAFQDLLLDGFITSDFISADDDARAVSDCTDAEIVVAIAGAKGSDSSSDEGLCRC